MLNVSVLQWVSPFCRSIALAYLAILSKRGTCKGKSIVRLSLLHQKPWFKKYLKSFIY